MINVLAQRSQMLLHIKPNSFSSSYLVPIFFRRASSQKRSFSFPPQHNINSTSSGTTEPGSFVDSIIALAKYAVPLIATCTIILLWGPRTTVREFFKMSDQADTNYQKEFLRQRKENELRRVVAANASVPGRILSSKLNNEL